MSDDPELEAIRQQRLAQMQGGQAGGKNENQKRSEMEEQKRVILHQILTPAARERRSYFFLLLGITQTDINIRL